MKLREFTERSNKNESQQLDALILDSYHDFVRLERRNLLAISSVVLAAWFLGFTPATSTLSGFKFSNLSAQNFISLLLL